MSKDYGDPTHGNGEQESACGFCHYWCGFNHYWGGFFIIIGFFPFIFEFPTINWQGPQSCLQAGLRLGQRGQGHNNPIETAENEQDRENIPKTPPKHLRHSKPSQNNPVPNRICQGKFAPGWRKRHRRESQPWQTSASLSDPSFWASRWGLNKFLWT